MERWTRKINDYAENKKIDAFLEEVIKVCEKHGFSISHEDGHGSFFIEEVQRVRCFVPWERS